MKDQTPDDPNKKFQQEIVEALGRVSSALGGGEPPVAPERLRIAQRLSRRGFKPQYLHPLVCEIVRILEEFNPPGTITWDDITEFRGGNSKHYALTYTVHISADRWDKQNLALAKDLKALAIRVADHADPWVNPRMSNKWYRLSHYLCIWADFLESDDFRVKYKKRLEKMPRKRGFKTYAIRRVADILKDFIQRHDIKPRKPRRDNHIPPRNLNVEIAAIVTALLGLQKPITPNDVTQALKDTRRKYLPRESDNL